MSFHGRRRETLADLPVGHATPWGFAQQRAKRLCAPYAELPHVWWPIGRVTSLCLRCAATQRSLGNGRTRVERLPAPAWRPGRSASHHRD